MNKSVKGYSEDKWIYIPEFYCEHREIHRIELFDALGGIS